MTSSSLSITGKLRSQREMRDARSNELYKTVFTETYVISGVSLLGNAGGILGMFVGFSFIGIYETLVAGWAKVSGCKKSKKGKMSNTHKS